MTALSTDGIVCWCECAACEATLPHARHPIADAELLEWEASRKARFAALDTAILVSRATIERDRETPELLEELKPAAWRPHGDRLEETPARPTPLR